MDRRRSSSSSRGSSTRTGAIVLPCKCQFRCTQKREGGEHKAGRQAGRQALEHKRMHIMRIQEKKKKGEEEGKKWKGERGQTH